MTSFRIVHLSDLHIARRDNRFSLRDLRTASVGGVLSSPAERNRLISLARWIADLVGIDAIIVTGDIANTGTRADLLQSVAYLLGEGGERAWMREADPVAAVHRFPQQLIMPGNHDRYLSTTLPGSIEFDAVFSRFWPSGFGAYSMVVNHDEDSLAIVACDLSLQEVGQVDGILTLGHLGQGVCDRHRLDCLLNETQRYIEKMPVVWAVHFPPEFQYPHSQSLAEQQMQLIHDRDLTRLAAELGVQVILAGHTHIKDYYVCRSDERVTVACAGTPTKERDPNWAHVLEFEVDQGQLRKMTRVNYELSHPSDSSIVFFDPSFREAGLDSWPLPSR